MKSKLIITLIMAWGGLLLLSPMALSATFIDTLEDIGRDGTPVIERIIGDVTVTISNSGSVPLAARTYWPPHPSVVSFFGAGPALKNRNRPLNPGNVSGRRFISTVNGASYTFDEAQPIVFTFSKPILEFGLTTLDLMENSDVADAFLTLEALNSDGEVIAAHNRTGRQGPSGLDLDWLVSSDSVEITQARLLSNLSSRYGGYGIDDLLVTIPLPAAVWLFGSGVLVMLVVPKIRRKSS